MIEKNVKIVILGRGNMAKNNKWLDKGIFSRIQEVYKNYLVKDGSYSFIQNN